MVLQEWEITQQEILNKKDKIDSLKQEIVLIELQIEELEKRLLKEYKQRW